MDSCAELAGPDYIQDSSREGLIAHIARGGAIACATATELSDFNLRVTGLLQMIVSLREYQFSERFQSMQRGKHGHID